MKTFFLSLRAAIYVAVIAIFVSCQKNENKEQTQKQTDTATAEKPTASAEKAPSQSSIAIVESGTYYFLGELTDEQKGNTIPIQGQLIINERLVQGKYHYLTGSRSLSVSGEIEENGASARLKEETTPGDYGYLIDFTPKSTGVWQLSINREQGALAGVWTSADGKKNLKAQMRVIAQHRRIAHSKYQVHATHFEFLAPEYAALNDTLARSLEARYKSAIQGTEALIEEYKKDADLPADFNAEERISQTDDMEIHHLEPDFVSYAIMNYSYTGGAHGSYGFESFNRQKTPTGEWKDLTFSDVFMTGEAFSRHLSGLLLAGLKKQGASSAVDGTVTAADIAKNNVSGEAINWFIRPSGVTFVFALYEVGAYVEGTPEVFISWKSLKDFVKADGFGARYALKTAVQ